MAVDPLTPPELLSVAYAPAELREGWRWLLAFDRRLGSIVRDVREPLIAQMKLAWWRDLLGKEARHRPKGEPMVAALNALNSIAVERAAGTMVDAWEQQLSGEEAVPLALGYAALIGVGPRDAVQAAALQFPIARAFRPVSIMALARQVEAKGARAGGLRLSWHGLTGR
jgi:Squalene/phytoene synthase